MSMLTGRVPSAACVQLLKGNSLLGTQKCCQRFMVCQEGEMPAIDVAMEFLDSKNRESASLSICT